MATRGVRPRKKKILVITRPDGSSVTEDATTSAAAAAAASSTPAVTTSTAPSSLAGPVAAMPSGMAGAGFGDGMGARPAPAVRAEGGGANVGAGKFMHKGRMMEIRDVWAGNLDEEMANVRRLVETHPYIAMVRGAGTQLRLTGVLTFCSPSTARVGVSWMLACSSDVTGHGISWCCSSSTWNVR